jgi:Alpha/beta hydrolase domain
VSYATRILIRRPESPRRFSGNVHVETSHPQYGFNVVWSQTFDNGLLRQYFPKGTDLSRWNADEIEAVAATLNSRPRKALGWKTPAEAFDEYLQSAQQGGVATIG